MLEEMVKKVIKKTIEEEYHHLILPAVVYAVVTSAKPLSETYELTEIEIHNDEIPSSYKGHIVAKWHEYTLSVIDRFGNKDEDFPLLPGIKSKKQFQKGAVVAVALAFGELSPTIIGEVSM